MKVELIYGPPGTGKTTTLMDRLETLLETYTPSEIAFVTFTKEGALQGVRRACKRFGFTQKQFPYFRTLHSLAFQELKLSRGNVMGPQHFKHFSKKMGMNFIGYYTEELSNDDDKYLFFDHLHRNNPKYALRQIDNFDTDKLKFVRTNYKKYKDFYALYDYTDMVEMFNRSGKSTPVRVAIIDEAQDLTTLQWEMVWKAFRNAELIIIAGDDDQAIYQWSGADVDYFLDVKGEPTILHHSYRLPDSILEFSKTITEQISRRVSKEFNGRGSIGSVFIINSFDEIKIAPDETYMFLSRNNCFLKDVENYIRQQGIMYKFKGKISLTKDEYAAIKLYEQVRQSRILTEESEYKLRDYIRKPMNLNSPWYEAFVWDEDKCNYVRDLVKNKVDTTNPKVYIGTIHSVKGGEADNVIMLTNITGAVKENLHLNPDSEHRVFYVGATRARKTLTIVHASSKFAYPLY